MPAPLHAALVATHAAGDGAPPDRHEAVPLPAGPLLSRPARVRGRRAASTTRRAPVSLPPARRGGDAPRVEARSLHREPTLGIDRQSLLPNRLVWTATTHRSRR